MARSLNRVQLIGNLTRDPELRYTPQGTPVCSFGLATNRTWVTETGERREETEFHRIVAWNKLAELCAQLLRKGRKVYVEGRLSTRTWTGRDEKERTTTEIIINDMIVLDGRKSEEVLSGEDLESPSEELTEEAAKLPQESEEEFEEAAGETSAPEEAKSGKKDQSGSQVDPDEIPF
jgi:single-strand DNA-binding protein